MLGIVTLILYITVSLFCYGYIKFLGKVSQANILPTTNDLTPFDEKTYSLEEKKLLVPVGEDEEGTKWSREVVFPFDENMMSQQNTLGFLYRQMHSKKTANHTMLYFYMMAQSLFSTNFYIINIVFRILNNYCYNFLLLFHATHILPTIWHVLFFVDMFYLPFLWFYNLSYFWYEKIDDPDDSEKVKYIPKNIAFLIFSGNPLTLIEMWILVNLMIWLGILIVPLSGLFFATFSFFFPLSLTCITGGENKPYGVWQIVKDTMTYQSSTIARFISLLLLIYVNTTYGFQMALIYIIAIFCLYMVTTIYQNNKIQDTSEFVLSEDGTDKQTERIIEKSSLVSSGSSLSDGNDKSASFDKAGDDKPGEDTPADNKSGEDTPADNKSGEDTPADDAEAKDEKSGEDTPEDDTPADDAEAKDEVGKLEADKSGDESEGNTSIEDTNSPSDNKDDKITTTDSPKIEEKINKTDSPKIIDKPTNTPEKTASDTTTTKTETI